MMFTVGQKYGKQGGCRLGTAGGKIIFMEISKNDSAFGAKSYNNLRCWQESVLCVYFLFR
jgi:hypothetical protein